MSSALGKVNRKATPQTQKAHPKQEPNNAGGYGFKVSDWSRLERFLIIGTDGGTYYVGQSELTNQNVEFLERLLQRAPIQVLNFVKEISSEGRAVSNSPAIFTLALAFNTVSDEYKNEVVNTVNHVCRTATHLFELAQYIENLGGWGRSKRRAIETWYAEKRPAQVAYQAVKYRQRNGWTHADLFRLAHPKLGPEYKGVGNFILGKEWNAGDTPGIVHGFEIAQGAKKIDVVLQAIEEYGLPWEAVPTQWHKDKKLWRTLFESDNLGQTALLRNVTRLAKLDMFNDMKFAADYASRLQDEERIVRGRMHPIQYLNALVTYSEGQMNRNNRYSFYGMGRSLDWSTNHVIKDALNEGFYSAFKAVEPAGKRTLIGLDVSGSMSYSACNGIDLSAAQVSAAMSMTVARTEPYSMIRGFSGEFKDLGISPKDSLETTMRKVQSQNFGSTDCSLPMIWALKNKVEVDTFYIVTDNETYGGSSHPHQALEAYRRATGIPAKMVVAGVAATDFSIANPDDKGMLDVVGFSSDAPKILADFSAGRI